MPFYMFIYVPEVHPITGNEYHERYDAHVLIRTTSKINLIIKTFSLLHRELPTTCHGGPAALSWKGLQRLWKTLSLY